VGFLFTSHSISAPKSPQHHFFHTLHCTALPPTWVSRICGAKLGHIQKNDAVAFSTLQGTTVGVDQSVWLHKYCHTDIMALCLNLEPKNAPTELLAKIQSNHHALVEEGITPYYCFDGFRHPMKKVA
jgi:hypothetical protein